MTLIPPEALNTGHGVSPFDCGKPVLNEWLVRHARQAQASGSARTFVVVNRDRIVGYFSLAVGQVDTLEAPERIRKGMGQYPIPVVLLARLAVSLHHQGRGIGRGLLQDAIRRTFVMAEHAGIRRAMAVARDDYIEKRAVRQFHLRAGADHKMIGFGSGSLWP